jgi:hypothetical protein
VESIDSMWYPSFRLGIRIWMRDAMDSEEITAIYSAELPNVNQLQVLEWNCAWNGGVSME